MFSHFVVPIGTKRLSLRSRKIIKSQGIVLTSRRQNIRNLQKCASIKHVFTKFIEKHDIMYVT